MSEIISWFLRLSSAWKLFTISSGARLPLSLQWEMGSVKPPVEADNLKECNRMAEEYFNLPFVHSASCKTLKVKQ